MSSEPFSLHFMCNFNDAVTQDDLASDELRHVWRCEWSVQRLERILKTWQAKRNCIEVASQQEAEQLLCHVLEATLIFVQSNFTGPFEHLQCFGDFLRTSALEECDAFDRLMVNGEDVNPNVKLGELLVVAEDLLSSLIDKWPHSMVLRWWQMRLVCIHQHMLSDLASNLYEQLVNAASILNETIDDLADLELKALLCLEISNAYLQYHRVSKANSMLLKAETLLELQVQVSGLLGMRTRFQQTPMPQLCLRVLPVDPGAYRPALQTNGSTALPRLLLLEDDTLLERVLFIEPKDNEMMTLPSILQAFVLLKAMHLKRSQPVDNLSNEQVEPYIQTLLYQRHGPLQVRQAALLLNCLQESNHRRTVERSWKQCEEAVKLLSDTKYSFQERISYGFATCLRPTWHVQLQLCDLLTSLGMTKTALDIYIEIRAWDKVIECYTRLELRHKAEEIIRQELENKPTATLYCLLGDATDDPSCYETAWEFSKHTSGKAQAHWGNYYYNRADYAAAIPHLETSVKINSLQEKIWLRLGYAAIKLERWELAVHAYITYTHLEPLGFEPWNNLAMALIKLGDKKRAHKVLLEALRCNYNNWKVWENFMAISVDTGNFEDALRSYDRLIALKQGFKDPEVLNIVANAISSNTVDAKGMSAARLLKRMITLMGGECIKHGNVPEMWQIAAVLPQSKLRKADKLVRAYRSLVVKEHAWSTKQPLALRALEVCRDFCQLTLEARTSLEDDETPEMLLSTASSARLTAQACIRSIERHTEKWPENEQLLAELKQLLAEVEQIKKVDVN